MAKDMSKYTAADKYMAADLGEPTKPVAPNYGLLEDAATLEGKGDANAISALGEMGKMAYQTYQYIQAAKDAKDVMESLQTQTWQGKRAFELEQQAAALKPHEGQHPEEVDTAGYRRVLDAQKAGVLGPERAQAIMAANMRQQIAANPGAAASIRQAYQDYSGHTDWDIREMNRAFQVRDTYAEQLKTLQQQASKVPAAFRAIVDENGQTIGAHTDEDFVSAYQTKSGPAWLAILNWYNQERKSASLAALRTALDTDTLVVGQRSAATSAALTMASEAAMHGIYLKYAGIPWEKKSPAAITDGMSSMRAEMDASFAAFKTDAVAHIAKIKKPEEQNAALQTLSTIEKKARDTIANITASSGDFLSHHRTMTSLTKDSAESVLVNVQIMDKLINLGFTHQEIERLKSDHGRQEILKSTENNPNDPMRRMVLYFENLRKAIATKDFTIISNALAEGDVLKRSNDITAAIVTGKTDVGGKPIDPSAPETVAAVRQTEQRAVTVMNNNQIDLSDSDANYIRYSIPNLSDKTETVDAFLRFFRSGKVDSMTDKDAVKKDVTTRMHQWLFGSEGVHYPARIKAALGLSTLKVDEGGFLTIDGTSTGSRWQQVGHAASLVSRANKLIELASLAGGEDRAKLSETLLQAVGKTPHGTKVPLEWADAPDVRGNNYLNLTNPGKTGAERFRHFVDVAEATHAYARQLDRYADGKTTGKKVDTVGDIINTWNNENERGSMPNKKYLSIIQSKTGLGADSVIRTPTEKALLLWAMQFAERGNEIASFPDIFQSIVNN